MKKKLIPELTGVAVVSNPEASEFTLKLSFFDKQGESRYAAMAVSDHELLSDFVQTLRGLADKLEEEL